RYRELGTRVRPSVLASLMPRCYTLAWNVSSASSMVSPPLSVRTRSSTRRSLRASGSPFFWILWHSTRSLSVALQPDLREFVALLTSHKVEFLVVGAHAVAFHGHPLFTADLDFLVRNSSANADRLLQAVTDSGFAGLGLVAGDF